jgi:hypothetical protein
VKKAGLEFERLQPGRVVAVSAVRRFAALLSLAFLCNGGDALARNSLYAFNQFAGIPQSVVTKMAPSMFLTKLSSERMDPFSVDGLTLGSKVPYGNPAYQQYQCVPSQKFEGFAWCTKTISDKETRGRFKVWFSILRAEDGAVVYVNRYQEPAYWSTNEVADDIQRYSREIGEEPHIIQLPDRPGLPKGTLATWGKVVLEPIVGDELRLLGEDKPLKKGIAIDFIGNFTQSARQGLPIYRLAGGAGFVWAASHNQSGRGTLRFSAVDASTYSPQSLPQPETAASPVAADPLGGAAAVAGPQPTFPPVTIPPPGVEATASPHRGEHLDCSAAPDCGAPIPAISSLVAQPRDPDDVIAQGPNYSTKRLQQTHPADGAGEYARESAASNFRSRERIWLDPVVTYWVWLIPALIAGGPAGYWLIRLQIARGRGSAEEARRAAEPRVAEEGQWVAEAQSAEQARRAEEAKAAEEACCVAEARAAEEADWVAEERVAEGACRAAEVKAAEDARGVAKAKAAGDTRRAARAKGTKEAASVSNAKAVAKTKSSGKARGVAKAKTAKKAGVAAAKGAPRIAKRSTAAIRPGRSAKRLAAPDEPLPPVVV